MGNYNGALSAAQLITIFDPLSAQLAAVYPGLGIGAPGEVGTGAIQAEALKTAVVGDGTSVNPGLGNIYSQTVTGGCDSNISRMRWDTLFATIGKLYVPSAETQIQNNVPGGWNLIDGSNIHYLNNALLRLNAAHTGVPTTPASAGTLVGVTNANGALPSFSSGNCPRVVHTLGGPNEWDESLPSAQATQIALSGSNNGMSYSIAGSVPSGVTWVKIYRGYVAGGLAIYFYDQKVSVTAGQPFSSFPITILQPDSALKTDWTPPAWLSCLFKPEAAFIVAASAAVAGVGGGFFSAAPSGPAPGVPLALLAIHMMSPYNVALGPATGFLGIGNNNATQGALFGTAVVGTGFTANTIQTANNASAGIQGFAGATKLQARVTSALNAAGSTTVTYSYVDATTGYGSPTTATAAAATFGGTGVGSTATIVIPAGRLILGTPSVVNGGGLTSGTYILEAQAVR